LNTKIKKSIPLWLVVALLIGSIAATASAITIRTALIEKIDVWGGSIQPTQFSVVTIETKIKGPNKIEVTLTLRNDDDVDHSATATIQLLDCKDNIILEDVKVTGVVHGAGCWAATYCFTQDDVVADYVKPFIIVKQVN